VLLLDEPFGALDAKVRHELRRWLRQLHQELHVTSLFVTHDQDEALEVADHVAVMNLGRLEQVGTPDEVYHHPSTDFVMGFLGRVDRFEGRLESGRVHFGPWSIEAPERRGAAPERSGPTGERVEIFLRPHDWEIDLEPSQPSALPGRVLHVHSAGAIVRLEFEVQEGRVLQAELSQRRQALLRLARDSNIYAWPRRYRIFAGQEPSARPSGGAPAGEVQKVPPAATTVRGTTPGAARSDASEKGA